MGGFWQLVFACCLLVQSLSAGDSVNGNSTSAANGNSTSVANGNSTSAANGNSTSAANGNSTSVANGNSTSAANGNSTSAANGNSTSAANGNSTSAANGNSTSAANGNSTSAANPDEELEKNIGQRIASLLEIGQDEIREFADSALKYYNTQETYAFIALENATMTVKKAVGTMVYLQMTLEKTNCTKKDMKHPSIYRIFRHSDFDEGPPKYCGPLTGNEKEQLDCKFDIFKNERSYGDAVVSHDCKPIKVLDKDIFNDEDTPS